MATPLNWKMLGELTVAAAAPKHLNINRTAGPNSPKSMDISLTAGRYADVRVLCNDAGAASSLEELLDAADVADGITYTVSVNDVDGKVTISCDQAHMFGLTWTDITLRSDLGFTANGAGATGYTSPNGHKYRFTADRALWWRRINDTELDEAVTVSHDGGMTARRFFEAALGVMEYRFIVADEEDELWAFWQDIMRNRKAFNLYPDRTNNSVWSKTGNPTGYRRWKMHESVKGWEPEYPHRPYAVNRHIIWPLRKDPRDGEFVAIGT